MQIVILICNIICIIFFILVFIQLINSKGQSSQLAALTEQNRNANQQLSNQIESIRQQLLTFESNIRGTEDNFQKRTEESVNKLYDEMSDYHQKSTSQINEINQIVTEKMQTILDRKLNEAFAVVVRNMNQLGNSLSEGQKKQRKEISDQLNNIKEEFAGIRKDNQTVLDKLREENQVSFNKIVESQIQQQKDISEQLNKIKDEFTGIRKDNQDSLEIDQHH